MSAALEIAIFPVYGAPVGIAVGEFVGGVGDTLGTAVGDVVGTADGGTVGDSVGDSLWDSVGDL